MVLRVFWATLGLLLGALERLFGGSRAPLGCSWESLGSFSGAKRQYWAPLAALLTASLAQIFFPDVFVLSLTLLGSILSSQDDTPTLRNIDFTLDIQRIMTNRRF